MENEKKGARAQDVAQSIFDFRRAEINDLFERHNLEIENAYARYINVHMEDGEKMFSSETPELLCKRFDEIFSKYRERIIGFLDPSYSMTIDDLGFIFFLKTLVAAFNYSNMKFIEAIIERTLVGDCQLN